MRKRRHRPTRTHRPLPPTITLVSVRYYMAGRGGGSSWIFVQTFHTAKLIHRQQVLSESRTFGRGLYESRMQVWGPFGQAILTFWVLGIWEGGADSGWMCFWVPRAPHCMVIIWRWPGQKLPLPSSTGSAGTYDLPGTY